VEHKGVDYSARILGLDIPTNLALLKVENLPESFNFLRLSDDPALPPPGTILIRLSAPLEFNPTPSMGLVGGLESRFGGRFFPCAYIRANIPAGPGDGGGAILDLSGKLVGIQVGSLPELGGTYLLPVRAVSRIYLDLISEGEVTHGWIGFEVEKETSLAHGTRLKLSVVLPDTPAAEAGMMIGDELVKIGGFEISSLDDLRNAMFYTRVGEYVRVTVRRDEALQEYNVRLVARPVEEPLQIIERLPSEDGRQTSTGKSDPGEARSGIHRDIPVQDLDREAIDNFDQLQNLTSPEG